jgi:lipopolysaccharide/colanic/teichoic acid biosynthesis glycosyltransferase
MHGKDGRWGRMFGVRNFSETAGTSVSALEGWYALDGAKPSFYQRFCKRGVDLVFSVIALVALLPLLAVIAGLVRVKLGPGVLYRQARVGRNGQNFVMLKFRTMQHPTNDNADVDEESDIERATHKTSEHPRLTEFGRTLRRLSIDELPQLWHVIRGQMSLVGPRPELSEKVDDYGLRSHPRHLVRPGLTGEWQVTHRSSGIHLIHCFDDDMRYVTRINLWQDIRIILRTFGVVLGGKGI